MILNTAQIYIYTLIGANLSRIVSLSKNIKVLIWHTNYSIIIFLLVAKNWVTPLFTQPTSGKRISVPLTAGIVALVFSAIMIIKLPTVHHIYKTVKRHSSWLWICAHIQIHIYIYMVPPPRDLPFLTYLFEILWFGMIIERLIERGDHICVYIYTSTFIEDLQ